MPPAPSSSVTSRRALRGQSSGGRYTLADYHLRRRDRRPPGCAAEPRRMHGFGDAPGDRWNEERMLDSLRGVLARSARSRLPRLGTYILKSEPGTSLRAAGWRIVGETTARS